MPNLETHDIRASMGFRDGEANELFALKDLGDNPRLQLVAAKVQNGGETDNFP